MSTWGQVTTVWIVGSERGHIDESLAVFNKHEDAIKHAKDQAHAFKFPFRVYRAQLEGVACHQESVFAPSTVD